MNALQDAIHYFSKEVGYSRLFREFANKLESIGQLGGSVTLTKLTDDEKRVLRNWFGRDYSKKQSATISLKKFSDQLEETKFQGVNFYQVIEGVIGRKISYKKEVKLAEEEVKQQYFQQLYETHSSTYTQWLTQAILNKEVGSSGFVQSYNQGDYTSIKRIYQTILTLPLSQKTRLPILAERITGDPHYFDKETKLISALQIIYAKEKDVPYTSENGVEAINELLYEYGILKDDIQNFLTCYGLLAEKNQKVLGSWKCLYEEKSTHNVPLRELVKYDRIYPKQGKHVFVVENSGVFSSILDMHDGDPLPLICTHGQFKLSSLYLIDKLCKENVTIHYAGDYDPEGLQMAQRLKAKYGVNIHYWRYSVNDYIEAVSERDLSPNGISKLKSIEDSELLPVKQEMLTIGKIGYQERHIYLLYKDILGYLGHE